MSVEFRNVVKRYGETTAVTGVSFTVETGTLVTLLGPSGCGKTTTLRMIAGLELPSEGRILIAGRDVTGLSASERDVSMVFQSYALFPHMTVLENVLFPLGVRKITGEPARVRALEALRADEHVDDDPRTAQLLAQASSTRVFLCDWPRNRDLPYAPRVERVRDLRDLAEHFDQ